MDSIVSIKHLNKVYKNGFTALDDINLDIKRGEILALLGPNGAGKTTLISTICGIINASSGKITIDGFDNISDYRKTRSLIGLVPQELTVGSFETVFDTVSFSRGLFGKSKNSAYLKKILQDLSLWDKKDNQLRMLSGGMKRRVLIAKALSHEPKILFLDEPSAGVDVELRKDMWQLIKGLRANGVTIILTTHYIEEAEEIADRIGIIDNGKILLVENKAELMQKLGKKQLIIEIKEPITELPTSLTNYDIELESSGQSLIYTYDTKGDGTGITELLQRISNCGLSLKDIKTTQSSLEDIFVNLIQSPKNNPNSTEKKEVECNV